MSSALSLEIAHCIMQWMSGEISSPPSPTAPSQAPQRTRNHNRSTSTPILNIPATRMLPTETQPLKTQQTMQSRPKFIVRHKKARSIAVGEEVEMRQTDNTSYGSFDCGKGLVG
ncbi:hypothetical protein K505DRAFT_418081 [Melanomma pulvis-pyrius CBS 109.77]|uniref:Uncharacterized protein n=1 Tax=Melanomma pulvis-pyrius CBS 109.77 TaxID=1314802 RepID=A0A6A6X907_9PLEO|nr:hypothetical protein K505DRAFT_418081 [Melanomma pulvis-pyrius CBS 109.77]